MWAKKACSRYGHETLSLTMARSIALTAVKVVITDSLAWLSIGSNTFLLVEVGDVDPFDLAFHKQPHG